jgi:hypothetical protein
MKGNPDSGFSCVVIDGESNKDAQPKCSNTSVAFLVDWGRSPSRDLIATVRYVERSIEVAKNTHPVGFVRLLIADRSNSRAESITLATLEQLTPLVLQREIVTCPLDSPAHGYNRLSQRTAEDIFIFLRAGAMLSPTALAALLTAFERPEVAIVEMRRLPVARAPRIKVINGFAATYDDEACGAVRARDFHQLSGFEGAHFGHHFYSIDFGWRARLAGKAITFDPDITYFFDPRPEDGADQDRRLLELAILLHVWSGPEAVQDFLNSCMDEGKANAVGQFQYLRQANALPDRNAAADAVANFDGLLRL